MTYTSLQKRGGIVAALHFCLLGVLVSDQAKHFFLELITLNHLLFVVGVSFLTGHTYLLTVPYLIQHAVLVYILHYFSLIVYIIIYYVLYYIAAVTSRNAPAIQITTPASKIKDKHSAAHMFTYVPLCPPPPHDRLHCCSFLPFLLPYPISTVHQHLQLYSTPQTLHTFTPIPSLWKTRLSMRSRTCHPIRL